MKRRDFLRLAAGAAGVFGVLSAIGCGKRPQTGAGTAPTPPKPSAPSSPPSPTAGKIGKNRYDPHPVDGVDVVVARAQAPVASPDDAGKLLQAALEPFGGIRAFVNQGDTVVIKPNLAWARMPEQAANTQPAVIAAVVAACREAGAGDVVVVEHTCDEAIVSFDLSGAQEICKQVNVPLVSLDNEQMYDTVPVSQGVNIHQEQIALDILDADVYINLPIAKVHGATLVTLAMKNQLGAVWRPQRYHEAKSEEEADENLHQNIADLATALRPTLNIIDATRVLLTNGPKGPGKTEQPAALVASPDIVAADAAACEFLGVSPEEVGHIRLAARAGVGRMTDLAIKRPTAA